MKLPTLKDYMSDEEWDKMDKINDWISVKDRLPENGAYINIIFDNGIEPIIPSSALYYNNMWIDYHCLRCDNERTLYDKFITHWMPLPVPPDAND
jgi:Protein of unknown function (DUF551)